jgi:hypothetical protein
MAIFNSYVKLPEGNHFPSQRRVLCAGPTTGLMLSSMAIHVVCRDDGCRDDGCVHDRALKVVNDHRKICWCE